MAISTTTLAVNYKLKGRADAGAWVPLASGASKALMLTVAAITRVMTIVDVTGLGDRKRQRIAQGLQDLNQVTIEALGDFDAATKFARAFNSAFEAGQKVGIQVIYAAGKMIEFDAVVASVGFPTVVGEHVKASAALDSAGDWQVTL